MIEFYSFDEAREAWGKLHHGLRKHGMESTVIDILISYFAATPTPPTLSEDLREARPMSDEAKTGARVLVHFTEKGWITVSWEDPHGDGDYPIWCVDDDKHGPYALRGYREGDDTHWMPLPAEPAALAQVKAS